MANRATAAIADEIAAKNKGRSFGLPGATTWGDLRDACDTATGGDFPPGELDKLTDMVQRRLAQSDAQGS